MVLNMFSDFHRHFYRHWLAADQAPSWVRNSIPNAETNAFNCGRCFMTKPSGLTRDLGPFDPQLKCCTYHPFLPNFSLGALSVEVEAGRLSSDMMSNYLMESRLTVLGAFSRKVATSICETGKKVSDKCPFLNSGQCSIHGYRPSTCSTYVCRSNDGEPGLRSWRTFEQRLAKFEWSMAHEVAFEIGFTKQELHTAYATSEEALIDYRRAYKVALLTSVRDWDE